MCRRRLAAQSFASSIFRPNLPIISVTSEPRTAQQLALAYANKSFVRPDGEKAGLDIARELKNEAFIGKSIRQSQLREKTSGLIVGIEKKGNRILNPESNIILEKNDILWIVGDKKLLAGLVHD